MSGEKFKIITSPPLPSKCLTCDRSANGSIHFVDWGFSFDYYGAVVLCYDCVFEIGLTIGLVPSSENAELFSEVETLRQKVEGYMNERSKFSNLIDAFNEFSPVLRSIEDDLQGEFDQLERFELLAEDSDSGPTNSKQIFT